MPRRSFASIELLVSIHPTVRPFHVQMHRILRGGSLSVVSVHSIISPYVKRKPPVLASFLKREPAIYASPAFL